MKTKQLEQATQQIRETEPHTEQGVATLERSLSQDGDFSVCGSSIKEVAMSDLNAYKGDIIWPKKASAAEETGSFILESLKSEKSTTAKKAITWVWPLVILALMILLATLVGGCDSVAFAGELTASYYTVESTRREGTGGGIGLMANGERLQDYGRYTCAMWSVPFGSCVRVRNKDNGRTIDCIVTDRGPARRLVKKGRIIDLNYAAMAALGGVDKGIIPVEITIGL